MNGIGRRSNRRAFDIWPGFVDALSSLLMVVIFVLLVFMVAQFYLSNALSGKDQALARLNRQIAELSELLALEREANADLRINVAQLSAELQTSLKAREALDAEIGALDAERDVLAGRLSALTREVEEARQQANAVSGELEDAFKVIEADAEKIELQLREIASLKADIETLRSVRETLEGEVAALATVRRANEERLAGLETALNDATAARDGLTEELRLSEDQRRQLLDQLATLRDRSQELETRLADEEERTVLAQRELEQRDIRIEELAAQVASTDDALEAERALTEEGRQQVALLNRQIAALRDQLARITAALEASERLSEEQQVQIADLGRRLNLALASKVEELARYRSEFFGRLREVLGSREDIRIVGDRFVFQSEVLFPSGSATLEPGGRERLARLAATLIEISEKIPPEVNWILRVDGHTDRRPISTVQFPSNWELSTARAISVVKFLNEQGIPADRLAATGFGEHQPIDGGANEDAFARNRRIEIKLDQR